METRRYFPQARIARIDSDTTNEKDSLEILLDRFERREIDILVGTQMIAKGLDFPNVLLVGIMAADSLLRLPDFRGAERNFALLAQVAGRSGRGVKPGEVILQTYYPEHHSIRFSLSEDYSGFYGEELGHRRAAGFPPYLFLAALTISTPSEEKTAALAASCRQAFQGNPLIDQKNILGPSPAPIARIKGQFRYQILVKHPDRKELSEIIADALSRWRSSGSRFSIDLDPYFAL